MLVHISVLCVNQYVFILLSAHLSSLTGQRLPNTASCSRDQVWKQILLLQPAVPAAAGSALSDLLNLPHFNLASTLLLSSYRSLAQIPKCPASSSQSPLSAAICLEPPPSQTDVAPSYKVRERKRRQINK